VSPAPERGGVDRERRVAARPWIVALQGHRSPSKRSRSLARPPFTVLSAR
jgi:hypothetical protein